MTSSEIEVLGNTYLNHSVVPFVFMIQFFNELAEVLKLRKGWPDDWAELNFHLSFKKDEVKNETFKSLKKNLTIEFRSMYGLKYNNYILFEISPIPNNKLKII